MKEKRKEQKDRLRIAEGLCKCETHNDHNCNCMTNFLNFSSEILCRILLFFCILSFPVCVLHPFPMNTLSLQPLSLLLCVCLSESVPSFPFPTDRRESRSKGQNKIKLRIKFSREDRGWRDKEGKGCVCIVMVMMV